MYYIGIDLGGTNIAAGIVDEAGEIIRKGSVPTYSDRGSSQVIQDMCKLILNLLDKAKIDQSQIHSIGVGSPGTPNREEGIIIYNNNLNFRNVNIRKGIQEYISVPVFLENDANCAAIAETLVGAAKGARHVICITIGTGIGSGVMINNRLYTGFNGAGGELGHHIIELNGEPCTCGRNGCWEAYSSATALIRQTRLAAKENSGSKINELSGNDLNKINAKTAFDAAKLGDETAKRVIENYIEIFTDALANIINIFQPDILVIGGGVSKEGEYLLTPIRERLKGRTYCSDGVPNTRLVTAQLGNDAGIVGAAFISKA